MSASKTDAATWPLDLPNVYGETRAAAITRVKTALYDAAQVAGDECGPDCEGRESMGMAASDLAIIESGDCDEFSLDGAARWSWTILADSACEAAARAENADCHD